MCHHIVIITSCTSHYSEPSFLSCGTLIRFCFLRHRCFLCHAVMLCSKYILYCSVQLEGPNWAIKRKALQQCNDVLIVICWKLSRWKTVSMCLSTGKGSQTLLYNIWSALAIPLCVRYPWVIYVYACIWRRSGLLTVILYIAKFESSFSQQWIPCQYINMTILMNLWMCWCWCSIQQCASIAANSTTVVFNVSRFLYKVTPLSGRRYHLYLRFMMSFALCNGHVMTVGPKISIYLHRVNDQH